MGEGGASVVLKCTNDYSVYRRKVLRIAKTDLVFPVETRRKIQSLQLSYYRFVLDKFIGSEYAAYMLPVHLENDFVQDTSMKIEKNRPQRRREKIIDIELGQGQLLDNLFLLKDRQYSVEIKPKWGFGCLTGGKCKFCRLQATKVHLSVGNYCPCKLFSGRSELIAEAIDALIETPRNQIKFFNRAIRSENIPDDIKFAVIHILTVDPLLRKLDSLQHSLYQQFRDVNLALTTDLNEYLDSLEHVLSMKDVNLSGKIALLTSVAIEDLSFIISFDIDEESKLEWSIKIIDVDIKMPAKITHYISEHDLLRSAAENGEN